MVLHDECPSVQVCMEFFHNHIDSLEFSLDVGITGLSIHEGLACKNNGLSVLDDAGSQPLE